MGNGKSTSFWNALWINDVSLKSLFPVLYDQSSMKFYSVAEAGNYNLNTWSWGDVGITTTTDPEVVNEMTILHSFLQIATLCRKEHDSVYWSNNMMEGYSAKSGYNSFLIPLEPIKMVSEASHHKVFDTLWKTKILDSSLQFQIFCLYLFKC